MYCDEYGRTWQGPYPFTLFAITTYAPQTRGVYQVLYAGGGLPQVAYIGIATGDTLYGRLRKHCAGTGNWALGRLGDPTCFVFVFYVCDAVTAKQIESPSLTSVARQRKQTTIYSSGNYRQEEREKRQGSMARTKKHEVMGWPQEGLNGLQRRHARG